MTAAAAATASHGRWTVRNGYMQSYLQELLKFQTMRDRSIDSDIGDIKYIIIVGYCHGFYLLMKCHFKRPS